MSRCSQGTHHRRQIEAFQYHQSSDKRIVPSEPVLHSEVFTVIKMTGVKFYAAVKIIAMHSF